MVDDQELAQLLRKRGLTCGKLDRMIKKQERDFKNDLKDANDFRAVGFNNQANLQEKISEAQKKSVQSLKNLKSKVCRRL